MRKRSKYKPRPVLDTLAFVLGRFTPMTPEQQLITKLQQHDALHALTHGTASRSEWEAVTEALNISAVLLQHKFDGQYLDVLHAAMDAHDACGARYLKGGSFGYSGAELRAVNEFMPVHEELLANITNGDIEVALRAVAQNIRTGNFRTSARRLVREGAV